MTRADKKEIITIFIASFLCVALLQWTVGCNSSAPPQLGERSKTNIQTTEFRNATKPKPALMHIDPLSVDMLNFDNWVTVKTEENLRIRVASQSNGWLVEFQWYPLNPRYAVTFIPYPIAIPKCPECPACPDSHPIVLPR